MNIFSYKHYCFIYLIFISTLFLLFYSYTTSPLYLNEGMDSTIYKTIGLGILEGKIPYRDLFDHKGPMVFYINALGQLIMSGRMGIFLLQIISLSFAVLFIYKTSRLFGGYGMSFLMSIIFLFVLSGFIEEGNQCEFWMLPYITVSLFLSTKYLCGNRMCHPLAYSFVYGLCFSVVLLTRINDAVSQIGAIVFGVFMYMLMQRRYVQLLQNVLIFICGTLVVLVPVILYFVYNNCFNDFIYGNYIFNRIYSGSILGFYQSPLKTSLCLYVFVFCFCFCMKNVKYRNLVFTMFPISILSLFLMGNRNFMHYYIVLAPLITLTITLLVSNKNKVFALCVIALFPFQGWMNSTYICSKQLVKGNKKEYSFYEETKKMVSKIPFNERNDIWCYNLCSSGNHYMEFLPYNKIVPCNRFFCCWMLDNDKSMNERESIVNHSPKWVLVDGNSSFMENFQAIKMRYLLYAKTNDNICRISLYELRNNHDR